MPPKQKYSADEILSAALDLVRHHGLAALTIRNVAQSLDISTQPVISCFKNSAALHEAVWKSVNDIHGRYLMTFDGSDPEEPPLQIGLNYIRFATEEPHLFQLLFLNGPGPGGIQSLAGLTEDPELKPMLEAMAQGGGISLEQMQSLFRTLAVYVHGYACLLAGGLMKSNQEQMKQDLTDFWTIHLNGLESCEPGQTASRTNAEGGRS